MLIKFVKSPVALFGLGYFIGDEIECEDKQAQTMIEAGVAVPSRSEKSENATEPKPEQAVRKPRKPKTE